MPCYPASEAGGDREWHRNDDAGSLEVLLCIAFAMLEEAVTTGLTNMAPLLGGVTDAARITASKNYFVVVFTNSVIVFVPLFICWGR